MSTKPQTADDSDDTQRVLIHKETGTRHIPHYDHRHRALCGYNGVSPDARDMWDVGASAYLADFPEDFGDLSQDCQTCAEAFDPN